MGDSGAPGPWGGSGLSAVWPTHQPRAVAPVHLAHVGPEHTVQVHCPDGGQKGPGLGWSGQGHPGQRPGSHPHGGPLVGLPWEGFPSGLEGPWSVHGGRGHRLGPWLTAG